MSLAATAVALSGAMFSHVGLDADAQGRAQLAWSGWRGDRQVARVYDVTTRRTHELQGIHGLRGSVELEDFDVAAVRRRSGVRTRPAGPRQARLAGPRVPAHACGRVVTRDHGRGAGAICRRPRVRCGRRGPGGAGVGRRAPETRCCEARTSPRTGRSSRRSRSRATRSCRRSSRSRRTGPRPSPSRLGDDDRRRCTWPSVPRPAAGRRASVGGRRCSRSSRSTAPAGRCVAWTDVASPDDATLNLAGRARLHPGAAACDEPAASASARWPPARAATCSLVWSLVRSGSARGYPARGRRAATGRRVLRPGAARTRRRPRSRRCSGPTAAARSSSAPARSSDPARCSASCVPTASWSEQRPRRPTSPRSRRPDLGRYTARHDRPSNGPRAATGSRCA